MAIPSIVPPEVLTKALLPHRYRQQQQRLERREQLRLVAHALEQVELAARDVVDEALERARQNATAEESPEVLCLAAALERLDMARAKLGGM